MLCAAYIPDIFEKKIICLFSKNKFTFLPKKIMNFNFNFNVCQNPTCGAQGTRVEDPHSGFDVCTSCGMRHEAIIDEFMDPNSSYFTKEHQHDASSSSVMIVDVKKDNETKLSMQQKAICRKLADEDEKKRQIRLTKGTSVLNKIVSHFGLTTATLNDSLTMWNIVGQHEIQLYCPTKLTAALVFVAALKNKEYTTIESIANFVMFEDADLCKIYGARIYAKLVQNPNYIRKLDQSKLITPKKIQSALKKITKNFPEIKLPYAPEYVYNIAIAYAKKLHLPLTLINDETYTKIIKYFNNNKTASIEFEQKRHLECVAAAFVYRACRESTDPKDKRTQQAIFKVSGKGPQAISQESTKIESLCPRVVKSL